MKAVSTNKKKNAKKIVQENSFPIVALGASAGGLEAITELFKNLPSNTGMSFIYVQHLSPDHKSMLTQLLSKTTKMKVQEIDDMDKIKPDNVFIIPYNKGIEVTDGHIKLIPRSENSAAISIDILFSSLAAAQKERVIGIILSGNASDGTIGMKDIKLHGGLTFAQDDSAKFTGMPHSAIAAGVVDFILSPKKIALELARLSRHPFVKTTGINAGKEDLIDNANPDLKNILHHLHKATGVDFNQYKMNTIKRRIIRRMLLYKIKSLREYAKFLGKKNEEIDILYQDLLINVTSFFRDNDTHKYLKENLFPKLLKRKKTGEPLRIWVPACATGEEAYSIAMMLIEIQESKATKIPVQIFASDLSAQAISKARIGLYTKQELETVSPKRIRRFFAKSDGGYRVNKSLRDRCVFAPHNILRDPPFSRLDFISCCNLFIYLDNAAQKKAINTFHYALNIDGFLMLGKSEAISASPHLFAIVNKKYKIFSRKINSGVRTLPTLSQRFPQQNLTGNHTPSEANRNNSKIKIKKNISFNIHSVDNAIDAVLLSEYMPASVAINHQMEIVQFRGSTDLFLMHPKGKATFHILKMARPEIAFELRQAIAKTIKTNHPVRKSGIEIKIHSTVQIVSVEVVPLHIESEEPLLLILFTKQEQGANAPKAGREASLAAKRRIKKLEEELAAAHADALAFSQEQEAFTEELQSANEEVVSGNEELQTVNEELETSKEEIESANEELTTTNQELQTRNDLLNESYEYAQAIVSTIHHPFILLDKNLRVKSANLLFYKMFRINEENAEGILLFDLENKQWNIPSLRELLHDIIPKNSQIYNFEITYNSETTGKKTLLLNAGRVMQKTQREQLILLSILDVTEIKRLEQENSNKKKEIMQSQIDVQKNRGDTYKFANMYIHNVFMQSPVSIVIFKGASFIVDLINEKGLEIWGAAYNEVINKPLLRINPKLHLGTEKILSKVYSTGEAYHGHEVPSQYTRQGKVHNGFFNIVVNPLRDLNGKINSIIVISNNVTQEVIARKLIEDSEKRYNMMMMQSPFAFAVLKGEDMVIALANESIKAIWGKGMDVEGKTLLEVLPEIKDQIFPKLLHKVYTTGIPFVAPEILARVMHNGKLKDIYFNLVYQPYREADETISGITIIATDITSTVITKRVFGELNSKLASIVQSSDDAIISKTLQGIVSSWNIGAEKTFGYSAGEMIGQSITKIIPDDLLHEETIILKKIAQGETINHFETKRITKKGKRIDIALTISPIHNEEGKIVGASKIARDITEQNRIKKIVVESEIKYRNLFTNSDISLVEEDYTKVKLAIEQLKQQGVMDFKKYFHEHPDFVQKAMDFISIIEVNKAALTMLQVTDRSELFNSVSKFFTLESLPIFIQVLTALAHGETFLEAEAMLHTIKENPLYIMFTMRLDNSDPNICTILFSMMDISERNAKLNKIKMHSLEFENAVIERTKELEKINKEIKKINTELEAFTYISSHDLQEPLRKIQTFAGRILEKENQHLSDKGKEYFRLMQNAANQMQQLILDLLSFSRINMAERRFENTPLHTIIEKVKNEFTETIGEKHATIEIIGDCTVKIIPFQFRQLLHNLISNALKFSNPKIPPHIIIKSEIINAVPQALNSPLGGKEACHLTITDNGIGFEKEFSEKIFEVFQRLHGKEEYPGSGIGLAIVKKIIENHNGIIKATSQLNVGTKIEIYIPT